MTMDQKQQIELRIEQLLSKYRLVQQTVDKIADSPTNDARVELFEKLKSDLAEVKTIEHNLTNSRKAFESDGGTISSASRQMVEQTVEIVSRLIPQLGTLEEQARSERAKLAPKIHDGVRAMQMQSAYSQHR